MGAVPLTHAVGQPWARVMWIDRWCVLAVVIVLVEISGVAWAMCAQWLAAASASAIGD